MEGGIATRGGLIHEAVAAVCRVVGVAYAVDGVKVRVARGRGVHHASEVVHPPDMGDTLFNGFAVVIYPFEEDVSCCVVMALASFAAVCFSGRRW